MKKLNLSDITVGMRVVINGEQDGENFKFKEGTIVDNTMRDFLVEFDDWMYSGNSVWWFLKSNNNNLYEIFLSDKEKIRSLFYEI